jgi:hypothetical protein
MKQKLHKELQALLDFYRKQRQNLPAEFTHAAGVINNPGFFTVGDLQRHLNNPLLRPEWVHVKQNGKRVELEKSCFYKTVQGRQLDFMDKATLNQEIADGAAVVLEGIDILDAGINEFVGRLDESLPCVMANSVVFFSQQGNEAYAGHCDADDVLVVQLAGKKTWQLFKPQQRRYAGIQEQSEQQLGPVMHEINMRPGDALYVRAGVPHRCITSAPFSMHMAFDLVDNTTRLPPRKSRPKPATSTITPANRRTHRPRASSSVTFRSSDLTSFSRRSRKRPSSNAGKSPNSAKCWGARPRSEASTSSTSHIVCGARCGRAARYAG